MSVSHTRVTPTEILRGATARALALVLLAVLVGAVAAPLSVAAVAPQVSATYPYVSTRSTLTFTQTVTASGYVTAVAVNVPPGSTGTPTVASGTLQKVSATGYLWRPRTPFLVKAGAAVVIQLRAVTLPRTAGTYRLALSVRSGSTYIATGRASLTVSTLAPSVQVSATSTVPGQRSDLTYKGYVMTTGTLSRVVMTIPSGMSGRLTSVNGALTGSNGVITWTPTKPIAVSRGARLSIPLYGGRLSIYGGVFSPTMKALTSTGASLMSGSTTLALIAPPAAMPAVPDQPFASVPVGCPSSWPSTMQENAKQGTGDWVIPSAMNGGVAAYLDHVSATCGDTVALKASSAAPVDVTVFRMGYYGGLGARKILELTDVPATVQPPPTLGGVDAAGHQLYSVDAAHWSPTTALSVDATWVPGTYLVKVSDGTTATYAPLTVRDDTGTRHDLGVVQATATWQAYNWWGGRSFYSSTNPSARITYDRPYADGQGSGQYLALEQGLVFWLEAKGYDVTYLSNNDLDELGGQLPARAETLVLPGHDEYYSATMRASLDQAMDRGVNVANFGANTVYRKIVFTDDTRRSWVSDRWSMGEKSTIWRYLHGDAYASQPLLGGEYRCPTIAGPLTTGSSWLFAGVPSGTVLEGFTAGEVDYVQPGLYRAPGLTVVASANATCRNGTATPMEASAWTHPSGARVFNGASFAYGCFLVSRCPTSWTVPTPSAGDADVVGRMVANALAWTSRGGAAPASATTDTAPTVTVPLTPQRLPVDTLFDEDTLVDQ